MTPEQAGKALFSIFDMIKVSPKADYPLRRFGKIVMDRNPENYFAEVEQAAFSPANTVAGIEPSAYTQSYRLGTNFNQIPINSPLQAYCPFQRDGPRAINGNYVPVANYSSSFEPLNYHADATLSEAHEKWLDKASSFHWAATNDDYHQALDMWKVFGRGGQQDSFIHNIISPNVKAASPDVQDRMFEMFIKV
ncbi:unnamed protein product [Debaryomyces tyrocola]|nr:unnamed protein product [Debaryomyces tyrocola]